MDKLKKSAVLLFGLINLAVIFFLWGKNAAIFGSWNNFSQILIAFGRLSGLLAAFFILTQLILIGRVGWAEKVFGLDKLSRVHHLNGFFALAFILLHPVFLGFGYGSLTGNSYIEQMLVFLNGWEDMSGAFLSAGIFAGAMIFSLAIIRKKLKYESWLFTHLFVYIAVIAAIGHQFAVGSDLGTRTFYLYFAGLYAFAFLNFFLFRFGRPLFNFYRHGFYVKDVRPETDNSTSIRISGKNMEQFKVWPGQFMIFRFMDWSYMLEAHPFSLSGRAANYDIRITIKMSGDFTSKVRDIKPGTPVLIDGPHGVFTEKAVKKEKALLIAGGVGITPIRTLAEAMLKKGRDIALLYNNRTKKDIIFKEELEKISGLGSMKLVHILSAEKNWKGEQGRIDAEKISRLVPDFRDRDIFLCGPPPMMESIKKELKGAGYDLKYLHYEKFSL
ncbi:MAG: ferredoxin reductase family protein [Patescibacteria group bacterium]|jgi:predicted ferric reductase